MNNLFMSQKFTYGKISFATVHVRRWYHIVLAVTSSLGASADKDIRQFRTRDECGQRHNQAILHQRRVRTKTLSGDFAPLP